MATSHSVWARTTRLAELIWNILVLLPKVNEYTRGIGLLEFLWKSVKSISDTWVNMTVKFHDVLHSFRDC